MKDIAGIGLEKGQKMKYQQDCCNDDAGNSVADYTISTLFCKHEANLQKKPKASA